MDKQPDVKDSPPISPPPTSPTPGNEQGPASPARERDTLLGLVELLLQEKASKPTKTSKGQTPNFEADRDVPSVDEHLQAAGAETFHNFQRSVNALDKELRNFANAARQLGSSVAILASGFHLRERLAQLLFLYRGNAADLFPRKISHVVRDGTAGMRDVIVGPGRRKRRSRVKGKAAHLHVPRPTVKENLDPEHFPEQLERLAKDVKTFLNCLNEFPEFTDEAVNASIVSFECDLKYWASCLREYETQFRYPAVQRYVHELSTEIAEHLDMITSSLCMFIEVGVPTIRFAQKHGSNNLLNLSTIATFFSAVTATTLQFSLELEDTTTGEANAVNCFWFASLVFSIAAAVNSLLGLTWKQAMYRSPGHRVPWWVLIWIKRSPLVFLVLSVACFSIGLCLFAYASHQSRLTSTVTTVLTAFTSFGLAAVSAWFASERWAFARHRGQKWLGDVLTERADEFMRLRGINWMFKACRSLSRSFNKFLRHMEDFCGTIKEIWKSYTGRAVEDGSNVEDLEARGRPLPATIPFFLEPKTPRFSADTLAPPPSDTEGTKTLPTPVNSPTPTPQAAGTASLATVFGSPAASPPSAGKLLWKNAMKTVKTHQQLQQQQEERASGDANSSEQTAGGSTTLLGRKIPVRSQTMSSQQTSGRLTLPPERRKSSLEPATAKSRIASLVPKLAMLEATQDLPAHNALVRHLQFSPDGQYLATSSWDRTSVVFKVGDPCVQHRRLDHTQGFVGQVAWSPTGNILLTKLPRGIKIWISSDAPAADTVNVCLRPIDRQVPVETLTWMPDGKAFLSVEDQSTVTKINLQGDVMEKYDFGRVRLHDVAVTPDSLRLVGVGLLLESPTGLQPRKSRPEKRLVVFNMETNQVESQIPMLNDVRDITIATNERSEWIALISYENKAPPQLWKIELVKDRENSGMIARLTLRHTYMPKIAVDFAGPSYFGGKNNELILCPGKAGDIHIWDQESAALLHLIRGQAHGGDLTCLAWNHARHDSLMFATGSHDGGVRVWTRPDPDAADPMIGTADYDPRSASFPFSRYRFNDLMARTDSPDRFLDDNASVHSTQGSVQDDLEEPKEPFFKEREKARVQEPEYTGKAMSFHSSSSRSSQ